MRRLNQVGSHVIAAAVGLLVVSVVAFTGYAVVNRGDASNDSATTAATTKTSTDINSTADLTTTEDELDTSSTSVDSDLNDSALDADLNDML